MKLRAVIADDEREARRRLARLLEPYSERIEVVGEAVDGPSAVEQIQGLEPDVIFLDIEMPGLDGFAVLDSLSQEDWPIVVFTTAYGHYATRAFDVHALDYLLKPISQARLGECLDRLEKTRAAAYRKQLDEIRREERCIERLLSEE